MFLIRLTMCVVCFVFLGMVPVCAAQNPDLAAPSIVINLPSRTLEFYSAGKLIKVYPVAIGKAATPSPVGDFSVANKEYNPAWYPPKGGQVIPSGPDNPLGYRWMEFAPLYGIHGTNAPWAIGSAVSNGCIRMFEADVEEVFEVIPQGTPVRITYDTIKIRADEEQLYIGVYPDVYGYGKPTVKEIKQKFNSFGVGEWFSDQEIASMIKEETDSQVVIAQFYKLKINGKMLAERVVSYQNTPYIPVWAVATALNRDVSWDERTRTVRSGGVSVPGLVKGNIVCVAQEQVQALFGGKVTMEDNNTLAIDINTIVVNGKQISGEVRLSDEALAVPVMTVAEALGQKPVWNQGTKTLMLEGKVVPVIMMGAQPYIRITAIYEHLKAYVYWNQETSRIELTYPFIPHKTEI